MVEPTAASRLETEATTLLQTLIRADSSNPPGGETGAAEMLGRYLGSRGVESELVAPDPRRANLVAGIPGTREGPSLGLFGHTDVVPVDDAEAWAHPPFAGIVDDEGWIWGRGAADMKNELATRAAARHPADDDMLAALVGSDGTIEQRLTHACSLHPMLPDLLRPLFCMTIAPTQLTGSRR